MNTYFHKKVWIGFVVAIAIISWLAITSYTNNRKSAKSASLVAHTSKVLFHAEETLALTIDLESGQRGFALTGIEDFLEPAIISKEKLQNHVASLKEITRDNRSQQVRTIQLEDLIKRKVNFSMNLIEVRRREGFEAAQRLNASMVGKKLMDEIRVLINEVQQEEQKLLTERTALVSEKIQNFNSTFATMLLVTIVILILVFYSIYISLKGRSQVEQSLRAAYDRIQDIYDNAPCGYHSIDPNGLILEMNQTWLNWLRWSREDIVGKKVFQELLSDDSKRAFQDTFKLFKETGFIKDLQFEVIRKDGSTFNVLINASAIYQDGAFVKSRSTAIDYTEPQKALKKIEQLNQELESFSYSVSHDLRAPLRSIDGYTQILLEDYAGKLDDEGKRVLNVVVNNARRMATLIDDLLDFSRVSRKELSKSIVNTEGMVRSIINEIQAQNAQRAIDFNVSPLDPCDADPNLLRQVLYNLISNAVKYTRKREKALINISSEKSAGEVIYRIEDNGTGFDMQYSHKLFGVFQRLHRQQEFEGTGVGLAIVHRIITRHGGRVWAEGEVDKGATFFISLPSLES